MEIIFQNVRLEKHRLRIPSLNYTISELGGLRINKKNVQTLKTTKLNKMRLDLFSDLWGNIVREKEFNKTYSEEHTSQKPENHLHVLEVWLPLDIVVLFQLEKHLCF